MNQFPELERSGVVGIEAVAALIGDAGRRRRFIGCL
jgi:hypothetical protein